MKIKNKVSAKLLGSAMLSSVILMGSCQKEQEILPDTQPALSEVNLKDSLIELASTNSVPSGYYDLTKALPSGYVKDGSKDYTAYIQTALDKYSKVAFPGFPLLINDTGLDVPSNRRVFFMDGSEIRMKPSSKTNYSAISIAGVSDVTLINPVVIGDRYSHKGTSGEWGHGIVVANASNINISKADVRNCWGDGIYIGGNMNRNIRLFKPYCKSNRREGIGVISVDGLEIISPYTGFSDGTAPYAGINIEPDNYKHEIKNVVISNPVTEKNKGYGIQIGFSKMHGGTSNKKVNVLVTNHTDLGSDVAFNTTSRTGRQIGSEIVYGEVTVKGASWQRNTSQPLYVFFPEPKLQFVLSDPKVINLAGSILSKVATKAELEYRKSIWKPTVYSIIY